MTIQVPVWVERTQRPLTATHFDSRFDYRVLFQSEFWIDKKRIVHPLDSMKTSHLVNVRAFIVNAESMFYKVGRVMDLTNRFTDSLHSLSDMPVHPKVTLDELSTEEAEGWLASTPLVRAIDTILDSRKDKE